MLGKDGPTPRLPNMQDMTLVIFVMLVLSYGGS